MYFGIFLFFFFVCLEYMFDVDIVYVVDIVIVWMGVGGLYYGRDFSDVGNGNRDG